MSNTIQKVALPLNYDLLWKFAVIVWITVQNGFTSRANKDVKGTVKTWTFIELAVRRDTAHNSSILAFLHI